MVVLALLLIAMLCLPILLALYASGTGDHLRGHWRPAARATRRSLRRMTVRDCVMHERLNCDWDGIPATRPSPAIENLEADLRRLYRDRLGVATQSLVWHIAVLRAYDMRLRLASQCLGVPEHLEALTGMDLEIERLRIEHELEAAGLVLRPAR
jgi:hypothetical protein